MHPIIEQYKVLVEYLGKALGPDYEIVLHDLSEGNYSVVAIANGFNSNRHIGSPITQKALSFIRDGVYLTSDYQLGYRGLTPDQKETISSTMFIKDTSGSLIGMLCINYNTKRSCEVMEQLAGLLNLTGSAADPSRAQDSQEDPVSGNGSLGEGVKRTSFHPSVRSGEPEVFSSSLEDLISDVVRDTLPPDTPVERLTQAEKLEIVRKLKENGVFSIKGAVREVARTLRCSEPSIYRYLKSI